MAEFCPDHPVAFFHALTEEFAAEMTGESAGLQLAEALIRHATEAFEVNVAHQCEGGAALACRGGCAACCTLRVTATAPEILVVAMQVDAIGRSFPALGHVLRARIAAAAPGAVRHESAAMAQRPCPFIIDGHCVIYEWRPLACHGHASFDEAACTAALAGEADGVPISEPHYRLRAYVQNALQSALRDAGFAWAIYEFLPALAAALGRDGEPADAGTVWGARGDPFQASCAPDVSLMEMAATFDAIKNLPG